MTVPNRLYEFGPFRLDPRKRLLWREGEKVPLKSKVFETLLVLVQNRGRVLEKDEMMRLLWPDTVVEENSLNKNISKLRQLLGESAAERNYIVTVPGRGYNFVAGVRELAPPHECYPLAQAAVARALEVDECLAEGYVARGRIKHEYERDWAGAERAFQRAIELSPNLAVAHVWYALFLSLQVRPGALAEVARAEMLDPTSLFNPSIRGVILFCERRYEETISLLRRVLESDPTYYVARWFLGMAYEELGQYAEAIAVHEQTRALSVFPHAISNLGRCYALAGQRDKAEQMLAELQALAHRQYVSPYAFVFIYSGLGETDRAFEWFERAYEGHDPKLMNLKATPQWDSLRRDPRFVDLLRRMGLGP